MHSLVSNVVSAVLGNYHAAMPRNIQPLSLLLKQSFIAHNNMYLLLVAIGIQYLGRVSTCMALKFRDFKKRETTLSVRISNSRGGISRTTL